MSWMASEGVLRRPPPPAFDPDDPPINHTTWQRMRGLWKEVRRLSDEAWEDDSKNEGGSGFRAVFKLLQTYKFSNRTDYMIGASSFSRCWYEIVEPYTMGQLTYSKDKLVAISSIVQDIKNATSYTYVAGLWKEYLLTDLLWFQ
jgi:hypothetical protein